MRDRFRERNYTWLLWAALIVSQGCGESGDSSPTNGDSADAGPSGDGDSDSTGDEPGDGDGAQQGDQDASPSEQTGDAGTDDDGEENPGGACLAHNGELTANGEASVTITNIDANLEVPAPGTIPCEGVFMAEAGTGDGNGGFTGSFNVTCFGIQDPLYYGLTIVVFGKPEAGDVFPVGDVGSVPDGMGGFKYNGEASVQY